MDNKKHKRDIISTLDDILSTASTALRTASNFAYCNKVYLRDVQGANEIGKLSAKINRLVLNCRDTKNKLNAELREWEEWE